MNELYTPYIEIGQLVVAFGGMTELCKLTNEWRDPHRVPQDRISLTFFNTERGRDLVRLLSILEPSKDLFLFTTKTPTHVVVKMNDVLMLAEILQLENKSSNPVVSQLPFSGIPTSSLTPNGQPGQFPPR
jgi:hypothetical protein